MRAKNLIGAAVLAAALIVVPAAAANAEDHGDGKAACNSTEICFQFAYDGFQTSSFQRHFYGSDSNHGNDIWGNTGDSTSLWVAGSAGGMWNRDSSCVVTVYSQTSYRTSYLKAARGYKGSGTADRNYSHKRCA